MAPVGSAPRWWRVGGIEGAPALWDSAPPPGFTFSWASAFPRGWHAVLSLGGQSGGGGASASTVGEGTSWGPHMSGAPGWVLCQGCHLLGAHPSNNPSGPSDTGPEIGFQDEGNISRPCPSPSPPWRWPSHTPGINLFRRICDTSTLFKQRVLWLNNFLTKGSQDN